MRPTRSKIRTIPGQWPRHHRLLTSLCTATLALALAACGGSEGGEAGPEPTPATAPPAQVAQAGTAARFQVTDAASPFAGTEMVLPADAVASGQVRIEIQHEDAAPAPLGAAALAAGGKIISKTLVLSKDRPGTFDAALTITVPYDKGQLQSGDIPTVLHFDETAGSYEAMAVVAHDAVKGTVSFKTAHFSRYVLAVVPGLGNLVSGQGATLPPGTTPTGPASVDTGMRPSADAFWLLNISSYSEPGGNCLGMASYADWYFEKAKQPLAAGTGLASQYLEGNKSSPDDDVTAQELIVRAHAAASQEWAQRQLEQFSKLSQAEVATQLIQAMQLTGKPQLFLMWGNASWWEKHVRGLNSWGHALLVYRWDATTGYFHFYDPNTATDDSAGIEYTPGKGFGSLTKNNSYTPAPDYFAFDAKGTVYSPADLRALYDGAAAGWNEGKYGRFTFSNLTVDPASRIALVTDRTSVRLQGQVVSSGGDGQAAPTVVDVYLAGKKIATEALSSGRFDFTLPPLPDTSATTEVMLLARCAACDLGSGKRSMYGSFTRVKLKAKSALENIGFESGTLDLWNSMRRLWSGGGTVTPSDKSAIVSAGNDPIATSIGQVKYGRHALRVNNDDNNLHISTVTRDIVVPSDGTPFSLSFAWAAVLEDPQHDPSEQPYVNINVTNLQTGEVVYQRRYFANDPSFAGWKAFQGGGWKAIDWQVVPLTGLERYKGHTLRVSVEAADCALGGHGGYAYLDAPE